MRYLVLFCFPSPQLDTPADKNLTQFFREGTENSYRQSASELILYLD